MALSLSNVINISVLSALPGLASMNTSALALITDDVPINPTVYGNYGIYLNPLGVASDFGSNSNTYKLANDVFLQNPNILTGGGMLIIIPRTQLNTAQAATILSSKNVDFTSLTASNYVIRVQVNGGASTKISIGTIDSTSLTTISAALNNAALTAAGLSFTLSGTPSSCQVKLSTILTGASAQIVAGTPTTTDNGSDLLAMTNISGTATGVIAGLERVKDCILRTAPLVYYFGIILTVKLTDADLVETAKVVQALDKMMFVGSSLTADIAGVFTTISGSGLSNTRCLVYTLSSFNALEFAASYASDALSTNFSGSRTVQTMHLKSLTGLNADTGITQTILTSCQNAGIDCYVDFGVPKTFTSGINTYYDQVYITLALKLTLIITGFNYLATVNTKIPQTEEGMNGLKNAYRQIMKQFVDNGAFAPGAWTEATTFGNPADHIRNIADYGYYIYSSPIALQSQTQRISRVAPLIQMAGKAAGAIHFSSCIVQFEA